MTKRCRANSDPRVVAAKLTRAKSGPAEPINEFVDGLRAQRPSSSIPYVDPDCGCAGARILMLFQDPGPKAALPSGSGLLSISNDDPSAAALCELLEQARIPWADVMPWNAVPWYTGGGNSAADRDQGLRTLAPLTRLLPRLKVIVTFGGVATKSWEKAMQTSPVLAKYTQVATLHPRVRGLTRGGRQKMTVGRARVLRDLESVRSLLG